MARSRYRSSTPFNFTGTRKPSSIGNIITASPSTKDVESTQELFKDFISQSRPDVDIAKVATGEHWYGTQAVELALVDELMTSDEYLVSRSEDCDVFEVVYHRKKTFSERFAHIAEGSLDRVLLRWVSRLQRPHVAH